ncbi:MAG: tRNA (guanosine(46)-N(7))-methyltransferase TrmB [Planctomycetota bacterium]
MAGRRPLIRTSPLCHALEDLPTPLDPAALFGIAGPMALEIGCGKGDFLRDWSFQNPGRLHVGLELRMERSQRSALKCSDAAVRNARVLCGSMEDFFDRLSSEVRLEAIHLNFPDPWPKKRHARRRLVSADRVALYARHLKKGGHLVFVTDSPDLTAWGRDILLSESLLTDVFGGIRHHWPCYPESIHQRKFLAMGRRMHYQKFARNKS